MTFRSFHNSKLKTYPTSEDNGEVLPASLFELSCMKSRSLVSIVVVAVLVLLALVGCGSYGLGKPSGLLRGGTVTDPTAAMFVPKQAPVMVSLLVNPDRLADLWQAGARSRQQRQQVQAELAQFRQGLLANTGLEYERDIQPWLGDEITFAMATLDVDRVPENGLQRGYLAIATTRDPEKSREFLQLFWQQRAIAGSDLIFEDYKGVKLIHDRTPLLQSSENQAINSQSPGQARNLATAVVGDRFVLFANHPKVLRQAINNVQAPGLNLASSDRYQQALQSLKAPRIGLTFVNLPALSAWVGQASAPSTLASDPDRTYQQVTIGFGATRQGLLAETALLASEDTIEARTPTLNQPVGALRYLPKTSTLALGSSNLAQLWQQASSATDRDNFPFQPLVKSLARFAQLAPFDSGSFDSGSLDSGSFDSQDGLALPDTLFASIEADYALGLSIDRSQNGRSVASKNPLPLDWIFAARTSAATEAAIANLEDLVQQKGLSVASLALVNQPVSVWTQLIPTKTIAANGAESITLEAKIFGVHASQGNYDIFASSIDSMAAALQANETSLLASTRFQDAIAPLPQPNNGYLYLDWGSSQPLLEQKFPLLKLLEIIGKPLFDNLHAIAISSNGSESGISRNQIFLQLSPST